MDVDAVAVCFIVFPLALVDVAVCVPELASTVSFVFSPLAFVFGVVGPDLDSGSVSHVVEEVSFVDGTVFKRELFDKLKSLEGRILLKIDEILVVSGKQLGNTI